MKQLVKERHPDPRIITLVDVMKMMTSSLQINEVLQRITEAVTDVLPCEGCILWLFQPEDGRLHPITIHGFEWKDVGTHAFEPGEGTIGTAFQEQHPIITNNLRKYAKFVRKGDVVDHIISLLDVPMILGGKTIGVLDAANKIPGNDFNDEDAKLLFMLATQAAIAIGNARSHEMVRQKVDELEILHSITKVIGTSLEINEVLDIIIMQISKIMHIDDCAIFLCDKDIGDLVLSAAYGKRKPLIGKLRVPAGQGLIGYVGETRKTRLESGAHLDDFRHLPPGDYDGFQTAVASALYIPDKLIGVAEIRDTVERDWSTEDLLLLKTITKQMAVFLEKSNLYRTVRELYLEVIKSLSEAVEAKDPETSGHCYRVSDYASRTAEFMGMDKAAVDQIRVAAHLHDIGKIGVAESILLKPARLTEEEYAKIKLHSSIGARILMPIELFGNISTIVRHHHERFDGLGYPDGLKGEDIPIGARILAVADSFEAMTWNRPYSRRRTPSEALNELHRCAGTQFDPVVVDAFDHVFEELFDYQHGA